MAFENANLECKMILGTLQIRSASIDKWILHTINVETFDSSMKAWVGEAISNGIRGHQNDKCFICDRIGHLKMDCRQGIPSNNVSFVNVKN